MGEGEVSGSFKILDVVLCVFKNIFFQTGLVIFSVEITVFI